MRKRIFGQVGKLKKDKIEEYKKLHAAVWPDVKQMIEECHLCNYSIFLQGEWVFAYFEYTGENYDEDMKQMEADPVTQQWWTHTHPCFETYAVDEKSEFYHDMQQIFYME